MKVLYKLIFVFLLFFNLSAFAFDDVIKLERVISYRYQAKEGSQLEIDNKFGDVKIKTWDKDQIYIKIVITAEGSSMEVEKKVLNSIFIDSLKFGNKVRFKTNFSGMKQKTNSKGEFRVNYQIFMPKYIDVFLSNSFGDIFVPDLTSLLDISSKYGVFYAEHLSNPGNQVKVSYGKGYVKSLNGGELKCAYSSMYMEILKNLSVNNSYGTLEIKKVSNVNGNFSYSDVDIEDVEGSNYFQTKYLGDFNLSSAGSSLKEISIDNYYSNLDLDFENLSYNFDVATNYSSLNLRNPIFSSKTQDNRGLKKHFIGKVGNGSNSFNLNITSHYGNVKIK